MTTPFQLFRRRLWLRWLRLGLLLTRDFLLLFFILQFRFLPRVHRIPPKSSSGAFPKSEVRVAGVKRRRFSASRPGDGMVLLLFARSVSTSALHAISCAMKASLCLGKPSRIPRRPSIRRSHTPRTAGALGRSPERSVALAAELLALLSALSILCLSIFSPHPLLLSHGTFIYQGSIVPGLRTTNRSMRCEIS